MLNNQSLCSTVERVICERNLNIKINKLSLILKGNCANIIDHEDYMFIKVYGARSMSDREAKGRLYGLCDHDNACTVHELVFVLRGFCYDCAGMGFIFQYKFCVSLSFFTLFSTSNFKSKFILLTHVCYLQLFIRLYSL